MLPIIVPLGPLVVKTTRLPTPMALSLITFAPFASFT